MPDRSRLGGRATCGAEGVLVMVECPEPAGGERRGWTALRTAGPAPVALGGLFRVHPRRCPLADLSCLQERGHIAGALEPLMKKRLHYFDSVDKDLAWLTDGCVRCWAGRPRLRPPLSIV